MHHCIKDRLFGFTLAEVLITLGIIGVVAALTMPSLIAEHQKNKLLQELKKHSVFWDRLISFHKMKMGFQTN